MCRALVGPEPPPPPETAQDLEVELEPDPDTLSALDGLPPGDHVAWLDAHDPNAR
ncbi:MAG TPA: hypothetical protein VLI05_02995 [Candidatus Saccharimonadia bacterium]|nr:hypothetical protein [Candidatus Saccharimonadia bacterium]